MARPALRIDAVLVQAVIAGALSFAHLHDLAAAAGQDGWKAWAYPVSVDLLLVAAWRRLRTDGPSRLAWSWFVIALVASLGANVATAGLLDLNDVPAWLRILVAAWPALAFMGGTLLAHTAAHHEPEAPAPTPPAPEPPGFADDHDLVRVDDTEETPELPALEPEPEQDPAPLAVPAPPVPAALVDHARKVAADHEHRTGSPIDTDTLRTRLGVPPQLADAIAAQLA
ncbi:DUF2637 domain-containing protein [Streptomyces sp. G6]|uniref:DUF2637 domain-containing protein n=1 Tax=Streptomyces sp. G6 TaxID=1178736 RepID=UPI003EDB0A69